MLTAGTWLNTKEDAGEETLQLMAGSVDWTVESILPKGPSWAFVSDFEHGHDRILPRLEL